MSAIVGAHPTAGSREATCGRSAGAQCWAAETAALFVLLPVVSGIRYNFAIAEASMLRQPIKNRDVRQLMVRQPPACETVGVVTPFTINARLDALEERFKQRI